MGHEGDEVSYKFCEDETCTIDVRHWHTLTDAVRCGLPAAACAETHLRFPCVYPRQAGEECPDQTCGMAFRHYHNVGVVYDCPGPDSHRCLAAPRCFNPRHPVDSPKQIQPRDIRPGDRVRFDYGPGGHVVEGVVETFSGETASRPAEVTLFGFTDVVLPVYRCTVLLISRPEPKTVLVDEDKIFAALKEKFPAARDEWVSRIVSAVMNSG